MLSRSPIIPRTINHGLYPARESQGNRGEDKAKHTVGAARSSEMGFD
jgi:hypothetical protein